jgi:hypothetical protein
MEARMAANARHAAPATVAAGLAALALSPAAAPAHPFPGPGYPKYANEGRYPEATSCKYRLQARRTATFAGRRITLKYFYNGRCGSFARIENAPRSCRVTLDRSTDGGRTWSFITETVDRGDDFAYTQVGNNLAGRVSRGALVCDKPGDSFGTVVARTNWF